jgi:rhodanese-related sulfurtransferase
MKSHVGHVVHCKLWKLQGLHTFVAMIGYCVKDVRKEHFKVVHIKKIDVEKNVSIDEYKNLVQLVLNEKTNRIFSSICAIGHDSI